VIDDYHCDTPVSYTFSEMSSTIRSLSHHFAALGVTPDSKVSLFAENSAHWLISDHAVQSLSAATAVRGADAPEDELRYIYKNSDSKVTILQGPKLLEKLSKDAKELDVSGPGGLEGCTEIVLINNEKSGEEDVKAMKEKYPELKDTR